MRPARASSGTAALRGALMIQGTTSDAGKSTLVAGLARVLKRRGVAVAPFKPQNMALNSAVTVDGGEIGRAQALQAQAAGIDAHSDMNPVLIKPTSDTRAQIIIQGRVRTDLDAAAFHAFKPAAMSAVLESYRRLRAAYEVVLVEGAGSPAEINLRDGDIANMGFAEAVDCPVLLIADIDRGGVFAHLVGTLDCLADSERARVRGFVINRFRGDAALLEPGLRWLEERCAKPVLGVLPYLAGLALDAEDAIATTQADKPADALTVAVPVLPRIANHTDFDALRAHPRVRLTFVAPGAPLPGADLVVLPGSKSTRADLEWLKAQGFEASLRRHLRYGGKVIGICGGMQMLGMRVADPHGLEGPAGESAGLGLLDIATTLAAHKRLARTGGRLGLPGAPRVEGYEIHLGVTTGPGLGRPAAVFDDGRGDGAISADGQVIGTYLHGVFDHPEAQQALLCWAGLDDAVGIDHGARREAEIDRLADMLEAHLDLERVFAELR